VSVNKEIDLKKKKKTYGFLQLSIIQYKKRGREGGSSGRARPQYHPKKRRY
jgi:hypothetical protein